MTSPFNPWTISKLCAGSFGETAEVDFTSGGVRLTSTIPSGELWGSVKDILVFEEYELLPQFSCSKLTGGVVVDVGAQVGLYSLKTAPFADRVIAFEPSIKNFRMLKANVERSPFRNVRIRQQALWSSKGVVKFTDGGAGFVSELGGAPGDYDVETTTIEDVVTECGRIALLKMDMEGAEYSVMPVCSEAALRKIERIVAEVHVFAPDHAAKLQNLMRLLEDAGFSVVLKKLPFQNVAEGLFKPWSNSLGRCNGRSTVLYRLFLAAVYGATPLVRNLKGSMDIGSQSLLFAYRR